MSKYNDLLKEYKKEVKKARDRYRKSEKLKKMWILDIPKEVPKTVKEIRKRIKELKNVTIKAIKNVSEQFPMGDTSNLSSYLKSNTEGENKFSPKDYNKLYKQIQKVNKLRKKYSLNPIVLTNANYKSKRAIERHLAQIEQYNTKEYLDYKSEFFISNFVKSLEAMKRQAEDHDPEMYRLVVWLMDKTSKMSKKRLLAILNGINDKAPVVIDEIYGSDQELSKGSLQELVEAFNVPSSIYEVDKKE